jgi:ribonuclease HI
MNGLWKRHKGYYISKYDEAKELVKLFKNIRFHWIPREQNEEANALSRKAYEEIS